MTTTVKTCFKCNKTLPIEAFYQHKTMKDGYLNKCKECAKVDSLLHREANIDRIREYDRNRGSRLSYQYIKSYRANNHEKYKAHSAVRSAVKLGKITKLPCLICGSEKTEAHHPDYSSPLDVVWLCPAHHKQTHAMANKINSEINGAGEK